MQKFAYREHTLDAVRLSAVGATATVVEINLEDINVVRRTIGRPMVTSYQGRYDMIAGAMQLDKDSTPLPTSTLFSMSCWAWLI